MNNYWNGIHIGLARTPATFNTQDARHRFWSRLSNCPFVLQPYIIEYDTSQFFLRMSLKAVFSNGYVWKKREQGDRLRSRTGIWWTTASPQCSFQHFDIVPRLMPVMRDSCRTPAPRSFSILHTSFLSPISLRWNSAILWHWERQSIFWRTLSSV